MRKLGNYKVFLTGSKRTIARCVWIEEDTTARYFIKWYGKYIEVVRGFSGYFHTVEPY